MFKEIVLSGKRGGIALVDDADYERVAAHTWYAHVNPRAQAIYARARIDRKWIMMHRLILDFPSLDIDHDNGSGLDNRTRESHRQDARRETP